MARKLHQIFRGAACWGCLLTSALAGEFIVSPVRVELAASSRSAAITVRNSGADKIGFQLEAMEWQQDAAGKDVYVETHELIFFPKIMSVEPGQEALVRIGIKTPALQREKTYRLFIQEMPGPTKTIENVAAQVNFLIRFGAPIFVAPLKPQDDLAIDSLALSASAVSVSARNAGNRHQVIQTVDLKGADASGKEVYALTLGDRYLLSGTTKSFAASIPLAQCAQMVALSVQVRTDKQSSARKIDVNPSMCR